MMFSFLNLRIATARRLWVAGILWNLAAPLPSRSDTPPPPIVPSLSPTTSLSLADARQLALTHNWDLLAARADVEVATAQQIVARAFPNPTVQLSVSKVPTDGQPAGTILGNSLLHRSYDSIAAFNQLLEIGGKRSARRESAKAGSLGAAHRFAEARRQLELAVGRAYTAVVLADEQVRVLRASAASLRKEADIAQTRLQAGDLSRADRDQIVITSDRFELDARRAEGDARSARIQLEVLLGVTEAHGDIQPSESLDQLAIRMAPVGWDQPANLAVTGRPDILAAQADVRKADAEVRLQKAQRIPDPTFLVQYEREPPDKLDSFGLGVSFPLPLWNWNRGNIDAATALRRQAEVRARQIAAAAAADLAAAATDYRTAAERRERYVGQIVPSSAAIRQTVRFAYEKGGASLLDLLTAERNDNEIRLAAATATADLARSVAALEAALGRAESAVTPPSHP